MQRGYSTEVAVRARRTPALIFGSPRMSSGPSQFQAVFHVPQSPSSPTPL
jgi:hypothetical protein